jgi:hypothetical protein
VAFPDGYSSSDLAAVFPRVFRDDTAEDKAAIQQVLSQIMAYPLREFDGRMKTRDWSEVPSSPRHPTRTPARPNG